MKSCKLTVIADRKSILRIAEIIEDDPIMEHEDIRIIKEFGEACIGNNATGITEDMVSR